ncbi:hypothetical protein [Microseira wollei]|uniref:Uncharacterized protein n=1 Tax=Microseira wollei NIES-4236 TaxID=2530354 RepID=A0AAV3X3F2_9CYAN|nr:hypothetical protein [Microseira wollei]GET36543.1 hypothetical protein MiSe_12940 [Microseira wollei NIES-4236]
MLRVTIDMFSGRPNPSWLLDENEAKEVLKEIANNRAVVASTESGYQGLGYRGILVELVTDETVEQYSLPTVFKIANGASLYESKGKEIAERLITGMSRSTAVSSFMETPQILEEDLQRQLLDHLGSLPRIEQQSEVDGSGAAIMEAEAAVTCNIELGAFNPGFWNAPAHVGKNNCYNYATNRRTDTFAQPGRATGKYPYPMNCAAVTAAALSDGAHKRFDCVPDSEKPRYLVAMVVAPGVDYHWYRKQKEGFWGHKPGGTPAKNVDNSGKIITNPETCDRTSGWPSYTNFCGYFYTAKSMKVN